MAYRFTDPQTSGVLVYAPCVAGWPAGLATALRGADCVLLDGSFFTDDEMTEQTGSGSTSRQMGHMPIIETLGHRTAHPRTRWVYTHFNNTNPVLVEGSAEREGVEARGWTVAHDGLRLTL